jgi:hypothetical protein
MTVLGTELKVSLMVHPRQLWRTSSGPIMRMRYDKDIGEWGFAGDGGE